MARSSVEALFPVRILGDLRRDGIPFLVGGWHIGPACGFSQFPASLCPHGSDQSAGLFLILFGGPVRADCSRVEVIDFVSLLDVGTVGRGQVFDVLHAMSIPVFLNTHRAGVDVCKERSRTPWRAPLPADVQDLDQCIVFGSVNHCGALVGAVAQGQWEDVVPRILDSTVLAYEQFGVADVAVGGEGGGEQHFESCAFHVWVVITPEESGFAVLRADRSRDVRQCMQLHVTSFPVVSWRVLGGLGVSPVICCGGIAAPVSSLPVSCVSPRPVTGAHRVRAGRVSCHISHGMGLRCGSRQVCGECCFGCLNVRVRHRAPMRVTAGWPHLCAGRPSLRRLGFGRGW